MSFKNFSQKHLPHLYIFFWKRKFNKRIEKNRSLSLLSHEERIEELKNIYQRRLGKPLDLDNPKTFTEKMQWLKLYDSTIEKSMWTDKIKAKELAAQIIGEEHIVKLLHKGVKSLDDIDFNILPDKFVIKTNHGSGTYKIVKDKKKFLKSSEYYITKKRFEKFLQIDFGFDDAFELHYSNIEPLIFVEEYIDLESNYNEHNFLCFHGEPKYIKSRVVRGDDIYVNLHDLEWNFLEANYNYRVFPQAEKPKQLDKLIDLARKMSKGFKHVRVDFIVNRDRIYFLEMTFTDSSGIIHFKPEEFDETLGDLLKLSSSISNS